MIEKIQTKYEMEVYFRVSKYFQKHEVEYCDAVLPYYIAKFIDHYASISELEKAISKLELEQNATEEDDNEVHNDTHNRDKRIYFKSIYKHYLVCPYCGYPKVPFIVSYCPHCGAGLN